jgi:putative ABC transport system ATP-binding protein
MNLAPTELRLSGVLQDDGPVVQLRNVTKRYGGRIKVDALQEINLEIRQGELVGILGPSGSGKTTLLHLMGTLARATSGDVGVAGYQIDALSDRELSGLRSAHIGFVFQDFFLLDNLSALENVETGLLYLGVYPADRRRLAGKALERVGLSHRLLHRPAQLSGGERQRVAIARAVVKEPRLLLADEPTGNLDTASGREVMRLIHSLNAEATTVAIVTHNVEIASNLPRQLRMRDGRIVSDEKAV